MSSRAPIVAIVGRPNVGKSTLFNRILQEKRAVVEDESGVTRDRNYSVVKRFSVPFILVDTGGFEKNPSDEMSKLVVEQTLLAVEEADLILAVFDGNSGVHPGDEDVVELLRKSGKQILYIVNKCDGKEQSLKTVDFYQLGVPELHDISALYGQGVSDMVEAALVSLPNYRVLLTEAEAAEEKRKIEEAQAAFDFENAEIPEREEIEADGKWFTEEESVDDESEFEISDEEEETPANFAPVFLPSETNLTADEYESSHRLRSLHQSDTGYEAGEEGDAEIKPAEEPLPTPEVVRVAIVGRPNVGKSTLLNTLSGEQRAITSDVAGTTRDTLDMELIRDGQRFVLVDTAGLRKKGKISDKVEKYSTMRSIGALSECDVAVVVIDATSGPTDQDAKIAGFAHESGKGIVFAVNKWDLVEKDHKTVTEFTRKVRETFKFAQYAPIVFISAISGRRCQKLFEEVRVIAVQRLRRIGTGPLNQVLRRAVKRSAPPTYRGQQVKLYFGTQVSTEPPRFVLFFNFPKAVHFSTLRFIKNCIRDEFGFAGTDIKLMVKKRTG